MTTDIHKIGEIVKGQENELKALLVSISGKDDVIESYAIKEANLKVMSKKVQEMDAFYSQVLKRINRRHVEEAVEYQRKLDYLTRKLNNYNHFPKNIKVLDGLKSQILNTTQMSPERLNSNSRLLGMNFDSNKKIGWEFQAESMSDTKNKNNRQNGNRLNPEEELLRSYHKYIDMRKEIKTQHPQNSLYDQIEAQNLKARHFDESITSKTYLNTQPNFISKLKRQDTVISNDSDYHTTKPTNRPFSTTRDQKRTEDLKQPNIFSSRLQTYNNQNYQSTNSINRSKRQLTQDQSLDSDKKILIGTNSEQKKTLQLYKPRRLLLQARESSNQLLSQLEKQRDRSKQYRHSTQIMGLESESLSRNLYNQEDNVHVIQQQQLDQLLFKNFDGTIIDSAVLLQKYDTAKRISEIQRDKSRAHLSLETNNQIINIEKELDSMPRQINVFTNPKNIFSNTSVSINNVDIINGAADINNMDIQMFKDFKNPKVNVEIIDSIDYSHR